LQIRGAGLNNQQGFVKSAVGQRDRIFMVRGTFVQNVLDENVVGPDFYPLLSKTIIKKAGAA